MRNIRLLESRWNVRGSQEGAAAGIGSAIAGIHAALGERERALDWLERGERAGESMIYTGIDPTFRTLHGEPRFRLLLDKLHLPTSP